MTVSERHDGTLSPDVWLVLYSSLAAMPVVFNCASFPVNFLWLQPQVNPAHVPMAFGLGPPGPATTGLVQPCPKSRALFHNYTQLQKKVYTLLSYETSLSPEKHCSNICAMFLRIEDTFVMKTTSN